LVEGNYVGQLVPFGDGATTGNHIDGFSIRDFAKNAGDTRRCIVRNNCFDADVNKNATGAIFIQPSSPVHNVLIENNLLEGAGRCLTLEQKTGYSNMRAINNRLRPTGWGAVLTEGPGWTEWRNNFLYDPSLPNAAGAVVNP
jgi:hypothetical protein